MFLYRDLSNISKNEVAPRVRMLLKGTQVPVTGTVNKGVRLNGISSILAGVYRPVTAATMNWFLLFQP